RGVEERSRGVPAPREESDGRALQLDERPARPAGVLLTDHEVGSEPGSESQSGNHPAGATGEISNEDQRVLIQEPLKRRLADGGVQVGPQPGTQLERRRARPDAETAERIAVSPRGARALRQTPDGP